MNSFFLWKLQHLHVKVKVFNILICINPNSKSILCQLSNATFADNLEKISLYYFLNAFSMFLRRFFFRFQIRLFATRRIFEMFTLIWPRDFSICRFKILYIANKMYRLRTIFQKKSIRTFPKCRRIHHSTFVPASSRTFVMTSASNQSFFIVNQITKLISLGHERDDIKMTFKELDRQLF